eukprot:CAMPEP_0196812126 /NCGR_PEP_ID=MMETSP1362-20130617/20250_1 /TAXON_ID=163516 /ORGANISM="Leptocylindrus danicus, Strain CCMP1856" /LENGTH=412 /DNA_ID=CAMNT_0042187555 /DNA_START=73 /DNA_END=1311 /DNA_ORIENTATION=+
MSDEAEVYVPPINNNDGGDVDISVDPDINVGGALQSTFDPANDAAIINQLQSQGFPKGLIQALLKNRLVFPLTVWVIDNSGSMACADGQRLVETSSPDDVQLVSCTRWSELEQTTEYHIRMASLLQSPSIFRLLNNPGAVNGPQQFSLGENGPSAIAAEMTSAIDVMKRVRPDGYTPLLGHIKEIIAQIEGMQAELKQNGQKVAVILATDGVPTDASKQEFIGYLKALGDLPVWLVFRLCTDEGRVVDYFSDLDKMLEKPVEVLDDFVAEAKEVYKVNRWINYALPIHRCREFGFHHRLFDFIDERPLTKDEVAEYCRFLFGEEVMAAAPEPVVNWNGFVFHVEMVVNAEMKQWNPTTKRVMPWINVEMLKQQFSSKYHGNVLPTSYPPIAGGSPHKRQVPPPGSGGCCIIS